MDTLKAHCNKCGGERRHEVLHKEENRWHEDLDREGVVEGGDTYEMLKCCGCETICLRHRSWFSEDIDERGLPVVDTTYYPPATFRQEPQWLSELHIALLGSNSSVPDLLQEIYVAIQNDSLRLAVMGIRALLENVMIDKVGDLGTFKSNLDAFEQQGFVSKSQRTILESILEAGHATIHRAFRPSRDDLVSLINITENVIESIYLNELRAATIAGKVPPRGTKKRKPGA